MSVWVNVRRWTTSGATVLALGASVSGCIDDFDDPKGYGGATDGSSRSRSSRAGCFEVCEKGRACNDELTCKRDCVYFESAVEDAGCSEEYEDLLDCALELDDICKADDACEASVERLVLCSSS